MKQMHMQITVANGSSFSAITESDLYQVSKAQYKYKYKYKYQVLHLCSEC